MTLPLEHHSTNSRNRTSNKRHEKQNGATAPLLVLPQQNEPLHLDKGRCHTVQEVSRVMTSKQKKVKFLARKNRKNRNLTMEQRKATEKTREKVGVDRAIHLGGVSL